MKLHHLPGEDHEYYVGQPVYYTDAESKKVVPGHVVEVELGKHRFDPTQYAVLTQSGQIARRFTCSELRPNDATTNAQLFEEAHQAHLRAYGE